MLIGLLIALVVIARADDDEVKLDQVALRPDAKLVVESAGDTMMHCGWENQDSQCFEGVRQRGAQCSVLWLGNSQIPAINEYKPGDSTAIPSLQARLAPEGLDLTVISQPNGNLQEHFVAYAHAASHMPLKAVVVSLVFDDTRETGLRPRSLEAMSDPAVIERLSRYPIGRQIVERWRTQSAAEDEEQKPAGEQTLQERSEAALNHWLDAHSAVWAARKQARGKLFLAVYFTRNTVFGIKAQSKRPLLEARYRDNLDALEALITDAEKSGARVFGYIAPLRPGVSVPYVPKEYERFKRDTEAMFARHSEVFTNMEDLVPMEDWGSTVSPSLGASKEIDFMHFMAGGHRRIADALGTFILSHKPSCEVAK